MISVKHISSRLSRPGVRTVAARALMTAVVLLVAGLTLASASLASSGAPEFRAETGIKPFSTRAIVGVQISTELKSEWEAGYAPAEASGQAPPENSPAWNLVNKGTVVGDSGPEALLIGFPNTKGPKSNSTSYLRHLAPGTAYYARFIAKNAGGEARKLVSFTTLPAGRPEVPEVLGFGVGNHFNQEGLNFSLTVTSATSFVSSVLVEANGSETAYRFEYALPENGRAPAAGSSAWRPFTSNPSGTITAAEEYAGVEAQASGLEPETTYYVRLRLSNAVGEVVQASEPSSITTLSARPEAERPAVRNVTAASAFVAAVVVPHELQTGWRLEWAEASSGPWMAVPGGSGTIPQALAEASGDHQGFSDGARLTGLKPATVYYVRTVAEDSCVTGCGTSISGVASFETAGPPSASVFAVHGLDGESLRLLGSVNPNSPTSTAEQVIALQGAAGGTFTLSFDGHTTGEIPYNASANAVEAALTSAGAPEVAVEGLPGGPYTVWFFSQRTQGAQPPIEADGLGLALGGSVSVTVTQQGGESYDTHYRFQYVSDRAFGEHGWSEAVEGPEEDAGTGTNAEGVGFDLPGLTAGEGYRYRLVAHSEAPGTGVVYSNEGSLSVPAPTPVGAPGSCGNEAFRTGPSANLPDCRAYELVSPANKQGAKEMLFYHNVGVPASVIVGEDGEHVVMDVSLGVNWGTAGQGPYLFSRLESVGWPMTTGAPQPQTGPDVYQVELSSADATQIAFGSGSGTGEPSEATGLHRFEVGPVGGPYRTVETIPDKQLAMAASAGWQAANGDFSKLVLATIDRTLGEEPTGTKSGYDLYEYTAGGGLRQLNVSGEQAETIGTCGAKMVRGGEESGQYSGGDSSSHSISADGSRVFFEAVPSSDCSEAAHLYMRVDGRETIEIGAYKFMGANARGTELLLQDVTGALLAYDTETHAFTQQSPGEVASARELALLGIPGRVEAGEGAEPFAHPRYTYWGAHPAVAFEGEHPDEQAYRYDRAEHLVECISCASPFDPDPKQPAFLDDSSFGGVAALSGGLPAYTSVSGNGDFAFFTTPAALVPQDANGEVPIEGVVGGQYQDPGVTTSPSSDVYEWRRDGVDGCARPQGCLALISDGRKGYHVDLLGVADEGRDVFFYSRSQLVPQDTDNAGDIYDARIGGGLAPPPSPPVECEGDACSTPPAAPNDVTPSSTSFTGSGNLSSAAAPKAKVTKPKSKKKIVKKKPKKKRKGKKARRAARDRRGDR